MQYNARLVVLMSTSEIEHLRYMAQDRGWSLAQMTRYLLAGAIKQENAKQARRRARERGKGMMPAAAAASIVAIRENGAANGGS